MRSHPIFDSFRQRPMTVRFQMHAVDLACPGKLCRIQETEAVDLCDLPVPVGQFQGCLLYTSSPIL